MRRLNRDSTSGQRQGKVVQVLLTAFFLILLSPIGWGQSPAATPKLDRKPARYWVQIEPAEVFIPKPGYRFAGSRKTIGRPCQVLARDPWIKGYTEKEWTPLRIGWDAFIERAGKVADARLGELRPAWKRDGRGRALYAELKLEKPEVAGFAFAPRFGQLFAEELGDRVVVVIPTTRRLFVFSARENTLYEHGEMLHKIYLEADAPGSREIFLLQEGKLRTVGVMGEDDPVPLQPKR